MEVVEGERRHADHGHDPLGALAERELLEDLWTCRGDPHTGVGQAVEGGPRVGPLEERHAHECLVDHGPRFDRPAHLARAVDDRATCALPIAAVAQPDDGLHARIGGAREVRCCVGGLHGGHHRAPGQRANAPSSRVVPVRAVTCNGP